MDVSISATNPPIRNSTIQAAVNQSVAAFLLAFGRIAASVSNAKETPSDPSLGLSTPTVNRDREGNTHGSQPGVAGTKRGRPRISQPRVTGTKGGKPQIARMDTDKKRHGKHVAEIFGTNGSKGSRRGAEDAEKDSSLTRFPSCLPASSAPLREVFSILSVPTREIRSSSF